MSLRGKAIRMIFSPRRRAIERFCADPFSTQREQLRYLLEKGAATRFGRETGMASMRTPEQFAARIEPFDYESFSPYIDRARRGERDVIWPGAVRWFARSSGTTDRSKYIPVTREGLALCHQRGPRDVAAIAARLYPRSKAFDGKLLTLGGSRRIEREGEHALTGDLSAILIENASVWNGWFRTPSMRTALLDDFEQKVEAICRETTRQHVTAFAGVPSWNLLLMERVLSYTGRSNLLEVWPDLSLFVHGGVGFRPYADHYRQLIPSPQMHYMETYNASEGFFAIGDDPSREDMLLMLDYGTYYEFEQAGRIVPLEGVRTEVEYAMLISSCNGLWRYRIGDTVRFTSLNPHRIRISGRTRQFINVFGEELMVGNAEAALRTACEATGAQVREFTVAPVYMTLREKGAHEWLVEFGREPADRAAFVQALDGALQALNSDYEAKRHSTLDAPLLHCAAPGTFLEWLRRNGKVGGQHKVPRLCNDRSLMESLLQMQSEPRP